jgi:hypothetical protein
MFKANTIKTIHISKSNVQQMKEKPQGKATLK